VSLIIHAPNVHQGGGRTLLLALLEAAKKHPASVALLDQRLEVPGELNRALSITCVAPTVWGRLAGEWALRRVAGDTDLVLCFGNLPPLFKVRGRVVVFVQNRYLVDRCPLDGFSPGAKVRLMVERLWLRCCRTHAHSFIAQTWSMQRLMASVLGQAVEVMAVFPEPSGYQRRNPHRDHDRTTTYDFLYVAAGEPHKNHVTLLEAWKLLAADGLYPSLCLTITESDNPDLVRLIEKVKRDHKLNLSNVTATSPAEMRRLYDQAQALVYPSLMESFGLPLLEARQAGLSILASELDYVRDVVDPEEVFDPRSPQSIARAVKRFLHVSEGVPVILTGDEFVNRLFRM
jgi:glycosyltransferase involved in cell wall biosynthesis